MNWKSLSDMKRERERGSWAEHFDQRWYLHSAHGSWGVTVSNSGSELESERKYEEIVSNFQEFSFSPGRECDVHKFCFILRRVEDQKVTTRLKEIWPNITKILGYLEKLPFPKKSS